MKISNLAAKPTTQTIDNCSSRTNGRTFFGSRFTELGVDVREEHLKLLNYHAVFDDST